MDECGLSVKSRISQPGCTIVDGIKLSESSTAEDVELACKHPSKVSLRVARLLEAATTLNQR